MGLTVNFSDFVNKTGTSLSASDYLVGFTTDFDGNRQEIRITVADLITYMETNSGNDLYTLLYANSGKWDGTYSSLNTNSGYWNSVYTTVNTISTSWTTGGTSLATVFNYLSTNNVLLSALTVLETVSTKNLVVTGNLSALGTTYYTNVSFVTSTSATFTDLNVTNLTVTNLTATNISNLRLNSVYSTSNTNSAYWSLAYTNLIGNSANYLTGTAVNLGQIPSLSAYWTQAYTNLVGNSANYLTGTAINLGDIPVLSANWNNTYTQYSQNSSNYVVGRFLPLSGGTMFGLLSTVDGIGTASLSSRFIDLIHLPANDGTNPVLRIGEFDGTTGQGFSGAFISYDEANNIFGLSAVFSPNPPINVISINRSGFIGVGTNSPDSPLYVAGTTYVEEIKEKVTLSAFNAQSTINFDFKTQSVLFLTLSSQGNWIVNFRGDSTTTLNNIMSAGQSFTCVTIVSTGTTVYYSSAVQIDGITYTPYYLNGLSPQAVVSNSNSIQNYAYTIIKRGNAVFNVLASVNEYY